MQEHTSTAAHGTIVAALGAVLLFASAAHAGPHDVDPASLFPPPLPGATCTQNNWRITCRAAETTLVESFLGFCGPLPVVAQAIDTRQWKLHYNLDGLLTDYSYNASRDDGVAVLVGSGQPPLPADGDVNLRADLAVPGDMSTRTFTDTGNTVTVYNLDGEAVFVEAGQSIYENGSLLEPIKRVGEHDGFDADVDELCAAFAAL